MKYLFLAEKPSTMKAVKDAYNNSDKPLGDIDFFALSGHVCRLLEPKEYEKWNVKWAERDLPMIPSTFKVGILNDKKVKELRDRIKNGHYDAIIVGTDSDVEGNGIYDLTEECLGLQKIKAYRFFESDLTPAGIMKSINNLQDYHTNPRDVGMTESYRIRSRFDWLIGFNMTTVYTLKSGFLMKVGRVKAPTLKLVYDNCRAIDEFQSKTSYQPAIRTENPEIEAFLVDDAGKAVSYATAQEASGVLNDLSGTAVVESFEKSLKKTQPDQLYKLTDIQYEAGKKFGYTPEKTLELIQSLYEKKLVSYPRTDGRYVSSEKAKDFRKLLRAVEKVPELAEHAKSVTDADIRKTQGNKRFVNDAEVQKSSHDALIPTGDTAELNKISKDEKNVLTMIFRRFLAIFFPSLEEEKTKVILNDSDCRFAATGSRVTAPGFTVLFQPRTDSPLPAVKKGQKLAEKESFLHEIIAKPPERYTQASLIKAMENVQKEIHDQSLKAAMKKAGGIGQPSSRAAIISELVSSGYVEDVTKGKGKGLHITESGKKYIEILSGSSLISPELSAQWEVYMDDIRKGEMSYDEVYAKVLDYLRQALKEADNETAVGTCPKCGGTIIASARTFKCSKCGYSIYRTIAGRALSNEEAGELFSTGKTGTLNGFRKKDGSGFSAPLRLDAEGKVGFGVAEQPTGYHCPLCGKPIVRTPKACKCTDCGFILWTTTAGKTLTESQIKTLFEGGHTGLIKGFKNKEGKSFDADLSIEDGKLAFHFGTGTESGLKCPRCGKPILENDKAFFCTDRDGCGFRVWKPLPGGKASITKKDMKDLLTKGKTVLKNGIRSRSGKEFSAHIVFKDDFTTGFEFENTRS